MKIKNFLIVLMTIILSRCFKAGPNASITGNTWTDYFPAFFITLGWILVIIAALTYYPNKKKGNNNDAAVSKVKTSYIIALVGVLALVFGYATYF